MLSTSSGKVMLSASQTMKNARPPVLRALARFALRSPYLRLVAFGFVALPLPLPLGRPLLLYRPAFSTAAAVLPPPAVALLALFLLAPGAAETERDEAAGAAAAGAARRAVARFVAVAVASAAALELVLAATPPSPRPPPSPVNGAAKSAPPAGKGSTAAAAAATLDTGFCFLGDRARFGFCCRLAAAGGTRLSPLLLLLPTFPPPVVLLRPSSGSMRIEAPLVAAAVAILVGRCPHRANVNGDTPCLPGGVQALPLRLVQAPPGGCRVESGGGTANASSDSTARDLAECAGLGVGRGCEGV